MTLLEYFEINQNEQWLIDIQTKYPTFLFYVNLKFKTFTIRYSKERMDDLFQCFILDNLINLNLVEGLATKHSNDVELNDLIFDNKTEIVGDNLTNQGYIGYNVSGDYANQKTKSNQTSTKFSNYFDKLNSILSSDNATIFKKLVMEFKKLLVVLVAFN